MSAREGMGFGVPHRCLCPRALVCLRHPRITWVFKRLMPMGDLPQWGTCLLRQASAMGGHLRIAQLLAVFGALLTAVTGGTHPGWTPQSLADRNGHAALADWLNAVCAVQSAVRDWSPLVIAAGCRLHGCRAARIALRIGAMDPSSSRRADVRVAAISTTLW